LVLLLALGCVARDAPADRPEWNANLQAFHSELSGLCADLGIPGLGYAVISGGEMVGSGAIGTLAVDSNEPFAVATPLNAQSITKSIAGVVVMQLIEEGELDLDAPVRSYLPDAELPDDVLLRHILTHTSEDIVGQEYVYSPGRYALLAPIIEQVNGQKFEAAIRERVLEPSAMEWYASPGLSAAGGMVSTTTDLARYVQALDRGDLLDTSSMDRLAIPSKSIDGTDLPISLGWFAQRIQGTRVVWSYGQDDTSALVLRVPDRERAVVLLAEAGTLSDAFRLLMGDASKSPFAMTFYRLFVASPAGAPLPRPDWEATDLAAELRARDAEAEYSYEDELIGQALIHQWNDEQTRSEELFQVAIDLYGVGEQPDPVIHYAGGRLPPGPVKQLTIDMGERLLAGHPNNRWFLLVQGGLLAESGDGAGAASLYRRILDLPNQNQDFLHRLFDSWSLLGLARIYRDDDPEEAGRALLEIIDCGAPVCPGRDRAETMLQELDR
jgi:hypothetical protein